MLNQSTSIGPSSAFAPSGVIAALAAKTRSGYSLDQKFYCDDEVFAADMQQVVSRKWMVENFLRALNAWEQRAPACRRTGN
jgi:hypothetical protein